MEQLVLLMHPYASEARNRPALFLAMAAAAIALAYGWSQLASRVGLEVPWWMESPSVLLFYGAFWKAFDLWLWSARVSRLFGWSAAPDLRGTWNAEVATTYADTPTITFGAAEIRQSSSRLKVSIRWEQSTSYSVAGVVQESPVSAPELIYQYVNRPDVDAVETMHMHRGTAWLELQSPNKMVGEYFSGRGREQWGRIRLVRR